MSVEDMELDVYTPGAGNQEDLTPEKPRVKWVPRPLENICGVCSSPATDVQHYGSITCYSCRAFFRRSVGNGKEYTSCARGSDNCIIDPINRTNCKKCRFNKCLQVGMKPEKVDRTTRKRESLKNSIQGNSSPDCLDIINSSISNSIQTKPSPQSSIKAEQRHGVSVPIVSRSGSISLNCSSDASNSINSSPGSIYLDSSPGASVGMNPSPCYSIPLNYSPEFSFPMDYSPVSFSPSNPSSTGWRSSNNISETPVTESHSTLDTEFNLIPFQDSEDLGVNIELLVEDCFNEELLEKILEETTSIPPSIETTDMTFEEEFRIHELMVRKEHMFSTIFQQLRQLPRFMTMFRRFLLSINEGSYKNEEKSPIGIITHILMHQSKNIIQETSPLFEAIDEVCRGVDPKTRMETLMFTIPVIQLCTRGLLQANVDKGYFLSQHEAAGTMNPEIREAYKEALQGFQGSTETLPLVKSFSPLSLQMFMSPWASSFQDEIKFSVTMKTLGELVKDDVKLGTIYFFLLLLTPSPTSTAWGNPGLQRSNKEMSLLIFRYLKSKYRNSLLANQTADALLRLIPDLHECTDIHLNRRIFGSIDGSEFIQALLRAL